MMTINEAKDWLYTYVSGFFSGATVRWVRTKGALPMPPYVTLSCSNVERDVFPTYDDSDNRCYGCRMRAEIDVYTEGSVLEDDSGSTSHGYENTAVNDLEQFVRYLNSTRGLDAQTVDDVSIMLDTPVQDLSELTGDTRYRYRSMAEFIVSFIEPANGAYGLYGETLPSPSGGGSDSHTAEEEAIEEVYGDGTLSPNDTEVSIEVKQEE